jgi:hypothetical protein
VRISLSDPVFDQDPRLKALRSRSRVATWVFVATLIGCPAMITLARLGLDGLAFVIVASLAGLGFFGGMGFFAYNLITLSSAVTRFRMERATRLGEARAAEQAQAARGTLVAQLQQIDQARAAGLIQEAEYQAKRAEIIARF